MEEKLDQILDVVVKVGEKVDRQNEEIERLHLEIAKVKSVVDEMVVKNRNQALLAGGIGGGIVTLGFELMRMKFGG